MERWLDGSPATRLDKPIEFKSDYPGLGKIIVVPIVEIRSPRGCMLLYKSHSVDTQCEAIRAFMEEHRHD